MSPSSPRTSKCIVASVPFTTYSRSVSEALKHVGADELLRNQKRVIIKPNLVNKSFHPVTTPRECVAAIIQFCRKYCGDIAVAEGSGAADTREVFDALGYGELSERFGVELIDLDREETVRVENPAHKVLREFHVPKRLVGAFVISAPVLKAHTMSVVTLSMKNLMGAAPARYYAGASFRKARLHGRSNKDLHRCVVELNDFIRPDLGILDATIGMAESHLYGRYCEPPVNRILASADLVALDAAGAALLGIDWRSVGHIALADGWLGQAESGIRQEQAAGADSAVERNNEG